MLAPQSISAEIVWPAILQPDESRILAVLFQLEQTQWWPPELLRQQQMRQVAQVLLYAHRHVPLYRQRFEQVGLAPTTFSFADHWHKIPILSRRDVQNAGTLIHSTELQERHGKLGRTVTSGSTGQPIAALSTEITRAFWRVFTLRDHFWHRRDFSLPLAAIRDTHAADAQPPDGKRVANWGSATRGLVKTGPAYLLAAQSTLEEQIDWLHRVEPGYLLAYPSTLLAMARHFAGTGDRLRKLRELRTFGEIVEPQVRATCQEVFGVPLVDMYSSQEVGYLALQCPDQDGYHVQSENVLVEILAEDGSQCSPGEVGRVVVTTLHNFAMPLIRYDLGDYAEVGEPCGCGRGLSTLTRILGRQRNMVRLPDGQQRWPSFSQGEGLEDLPPLYQFQVIQRTRTDIEALYVSPQPLTDSEQDRIKKYLAETLGYPFQFTLTRVDSISRSPSGKFEEFRSEVLHQPTAER